MHHIVAETVRDPQWVSEDGTRVNCIVKFSHIKEEHEFTAYAFDSELHGREIWAGCVRGEYGEVKPYIPSNNSVVAPPNELPEELRVFSVFLETVNAENTRKSFRSVAILWGAMLDETLNDLLLTYKKLNPETNVKANTLNNKIDRTFQFQLITDQQKDRLDHIRLIRNEVAHNWNLTLENEKFNYSLKTLYFLDHSENFEYLENLDFLLQMIFSGSCAMIVLELKNRIETFINEL